MKYNKRDLETAISILQDLQTDILLGEFDGWGLDNDTVFIVRSWLKNINNGVFGDRVYEI